MTKNLKSAKNGKIFALAVTVICFALCITLADLFSTAITAGNFSGLFATTNKISGYDIYMISMFQSSVRSLADDSAKKVTEQNGAGYVWELDSVYYVIASAYENQNDAELVKQNLTNSGHTPSILKISVEEVDITSNLQANEQNAIINALSVFKTTYKSFYDLAISLDTSVKNETDCKLILNDTLSKISKTKTAFESAFAAKMTNNMLQIKLKLESAESLTRELIDYTPTTSCSFSAKLKYNYVQIIALNKSICKEINYSI